ncbi:BnaA04g21170D [Brassica napus]|uniref:BnaA04g21170D protein n=1 Tax=Brassica napus TaxID=3708 RepID=A0A078FVM4_BRANA|nr:BnaA04g21170D [Brassica napus]
MVPWYVYLEALFCLSGFSYLETALFCGCVYAAKKPTRQWAAWTHQEEECFFTALRQVGKNFLKITSHVQSKNKDQVGHYYCRLDTNAAMLRWWSLLEKHSCKASKLHLKPRRFKLFLEALEHQLLKDSRKSTSKRACHGETFSSASLENISSQSRERGLDNRPLKMILCDSQNVKKLGPGRSSTKQGTSSTSFYAVLLRLILWVCVQSVLPASAGFRKWEKAAIDGVSLVADAAEHLERTSINKDMDAQKGLLAIE